jgi:hypothetical protein
MSIEIISSTLFSLEQTDFSKIVRSDIFPALWNLSGTDRDGG